MTAPVKALNGQRPGAARPQRCQILIVALTRQAPDAGSSAVLHGAGVPATFPQRVTLWVYSVEKLLCACTPKSLEDVLR